MDLREILVRHLDHMQAALRDVLFRGSEALLDVGEAAYGSMSVEIFLHGEDKKRSPLAKKLVRPCDRLPFWRAPQSRPVSNWRSLQKALAPSAVHAPAAEDRPPIDVEL